MGGRGRPALCLPYRREVLSAFLGYKEESHLVLSHFINDCFQSDLMIIRLSL